MAFMNFRSTNNNALELLVGFVENNTTFITKLSYLFSNYGFKYDDRGNDLVKWNEEKLAYFGNSTGLSLGIILIDIYNSVQNMKIRVFFFELDNYVINKELEANIYNNYLAFSSTVKLKGESSISDDKSFSIFLLFGYVNGTDDYINISKYFNENIEGNNNNYNLVLDLTENAIIENNIFGYEILNNQIKLVYIPEFLLFYNKKEENLLLKNDDILEEKYLLKNKGNSNSNGNNYLEYQIIISEADFDTFNTYPSSIINCSMKNMDFVDEREFYYKKIFYGRTNTLTFLDKLPCYEFCSTCTELGTSINDQKCLSC